MFTQIVHYFFKKSSYIFFSIAFSGEILLNAIEQYVINVVRFKNPFFAHKEYCLTVTNLNLEELNINTFFSKTS